MGGPTTTGGRRREAGRQVMSCEQWEEVRAIYRLSPRELQVVQCLFDQDKTARIARRLNLSPHTVDGYVRRVFDKLGVCSRSEILLRIMGGRVVDAAD